MPVFPPNPNSEWLTQVSRPAMATEFVVMLASQHADSVEQALAALELIDDIERQLTVYRPDSEISRVNREAASKPVPVSESTFGLIQRAVDWSVNTDGRFDITAGPLVQAWGFTQRQGRRPSDDEIEAALAVVGFEKLLLDPVQRTVAFSVPGMSINLGGIGKGFALDRVAQRLVEQGIVNFLIHGGQSSVLARGDQVAGNASDADTTRGWAVGIEHPTRPKLRLAGFWLRDAALGTSGSSKQFFHHRGQRMGHVIDHRSGFPTTDLISLSILAANATDADAVGTGMFLAGSERLKALVDDREKLLDGIECGGWPMLSVRVGQRQDEYITTATGEWDWIDPPGDEDGAAKT